MRESRRLEQVQADLLSANCRLVDDTERFHASELHQLRERLDDQVRQLESDCESVRDDREHLKTAGEELMRQVQSEAAQSKHNVQAKTREMIERRLAHKQTLKQKIEEISTQMAESGRIRMRKSATLGGLTTKVAEECQRLRDLTDRNQKSSARLAQQRDDIQHATSAALSLRRELGRLSNENEFVKLATNHIERSQTKVNAVLTEVQNGLDSHTQTIRALEQRSTDLGVRLEAVQRKKHASQEALETAQNQLRRVSRMKEAYVNYIMSGFRCIHNPTEFDHVWAALLGNLP